MSERPKWRRWRWVVLALIVASAPVQYIVGYFALSEYGEGYDWELMHVRSFKSRTIAVLYEPLGWVESEIRDAPVSILSGDPRKELVRFSPIRELGNPRQSDHSKSVRMPN